MKVSAYCLDWHVSKSQAFVDMLVEPLRKYADIKLEAWDGEKLPKKALDEPLAIFCMLPPTETFLREYIGKIVWLPMWDQAQGYDQKWWDKLPKNLYVVAFSKQIEIKATKAKLPMIKLKYFKNPNKFKAASWSKGPVIFYWNRTGLVGPEFLENLCLSVSAKKVIFLGDIDPRIDEGKSYQLASKVGNTPVLNLSHGERDKYLSAIDESNIFIAPRASEGVGMTFLEAMAKGSGVLAYDAPTMNEYINNKNGVLLRNKPLSRFDKLVGMSTPDLPSDETYYLSSQQNWDMISRLDFRRLGDRARADHFEGYQKWLEQTAKYARFVLEKI